MVIGLASEWELWGCSWIMHDNQGELTGSQVHGTETEGVSRHSRYGPQFSEGWSGSEGWATTAFPPSVVQVWSGQTSQSSMLQWERKTGLSLIDKQSNWQWQSMVLKMNIASNSSTPVSSSIKSKHMDLIIKVFTSTMFHPNKMNTDNCLVLTRS